MRQTGIMVAPDACSLVRPNVRANRPAEADAVSLAAMMHHVPRTRLTVLAVAGPVERGVRQHCSRSAGVARATLDQPRCNCR